jgi:hypothetical protein
MLQRREGKSQQAEFDAVLEEVMKSLFEEDRVAV